MLVIYSILLVFERILIEYKRGKSRREINEFVLCIKREKLLLYNSSVMRPVRPPLSLPLPLKVGIHAWTSNIKPSTGRSLYRTFDTSGYRREFYIFTLGFMLLVFTPSPPHPNYPMKNWNLEQNPPHPFLLLFLLCFNREKRPKKPKIPWHIYRC